MHIHGREISLLQLLRHIGADHLAAVQTADRIHHRFNREPLNKGLSHRRRFRTPGLQPRHIHIIVNVRMAGCKMPGNRSQNDVVSGL